MNRVRFLSLVASLTPLLAVGVPEVSAAAWSVAEQPELKQALEDAPALQTESLGEPARGVNVWERWLVPNTDGKSWDLLQIYFKEYYGPTWLYAVDLGSGDVKKQRLPDGHQFYLSGRALGFDGKFYIATPSRRTGNMHLFVYDPATNSLEDRSRTRRRSSSARGRTRWPDLRHGQSGQSGRALHLRSEVEQGRQGLRRCRPKASQRRLEPLRAGCG